MNKEDFERVGYSSCSSVVYLHNEKCLELHCNQYNKGNCVVSHLKRTVFAQMNDGNTSQKLFDIDGLHLMNHRDNFSLVEARTCSFHMALSVQFDFAKFPR